VDEWLTSGNYKVTKVTEAKPHDTDDFLGMSSGAPKTIEVERTGPAVKEHIIKAEDEGYAHIFKFNPNHDRKGRFAASGAPTAVKDPAELEQVLRVMAGRDAHPNIMDLSVGGTKPFGGLGDKISRQRMPQIPTKRRQEFLDSLHVNVVQESVDPMNLKPTQDQLDGQKIGQFFEKMADPNGKFHEHEPILVSKDNYIIDGHHHWGTYVAYNLIRGPKKIPAYVVHMDQKTLLQKAQEFTDAHNIERKTIGKGELAHVFTQKFNPNHEPGGSSHGGEFAKGAGAGGGEAQDVSMSDYYTSRDSHVTPLDIMSKLSKDERREVEYATLKAETSPNSVALYTHDGVFTDERKQLHQQIIDSYFTKENVAAATPAAGEAPTLVVLGGRGGSGKGSFTNGKINEFDPSKFIKLDSDEIKGHLRPPYEGWNAASVHLEATELVNVIRSTAIARGMNVILDATLKSRSMEADIQHAIANGYRVEGHYMYVSRAEAATRAMKRYLGKDPQHRGRLVPADVILGNTKNEENFDYFKKYFDKWSAYDNMGKAPVLIGKGSK
jgi:predicted ABC-type ATPase